MSPRRPPVRDELLRERLDELARTTDLSILAPDPLELVHRYDDPLDREVAGLVAAAFAYGRADIVLRNAGGVLERMGPSPHAWLAEEFDRRQASRRFRDFSHRFHKVRDLVALLERLAAIIRSHGSLGALFRSVHTASDPDIGPSLARFVDAIIASVDRPAPRSIHYLLTSPADGSACKRMNLFLRWMVRREPPDLGLWTFVDPRQLVMPVDTHIHRITTFLGLNTRKSADWKTAVAITERMRRFDAADPVRYDFAICRLGILDLCSRRQSKELCDLCLLRDVCRLRMR